VITIKKLNSLPPMTRLRKIVLLLQAEERELDRGRPPHREYLASLCRLLADEPRCGEEVRNAAAACVRLCGAPDSPPPDRLLRAVNEVRHALLRSLGAEPAEWDLLNPAATGLDAAARTVLPIRLYLEEIRSPFNVGAIFRTSEAFGVEELLLSATTASPLHPRSLKSARGAIGIMPWRHAELQELQQSEDGDSYGEQGGIFALELGGTPLGSFRFPERGIMLVGSEELGLSPQSLQLAARGAGRVSIPMIGAKRSLNVSVAVGIVLQAWQEAITGR
jgi:TrmH family RNA methyltransferase